MSLLLLCTLCTRMRFNSRDNPHAALLQEAWMVLCPTPLLLLPKVQLLLCKAGLGWSCRRTSQAAE